MRVDYFLFRASLISWIVLDSSFGGKALAQTCDQCFFTSDDADDCRVYGKIDGQLTSWRKAPQECLDAYNIKNTGIDPFSAGCDPSNANTFVNSGLRAGVIPNSVLGGLGVSEGGFFEQQQSGSYVLKDSITVNGETISCETSASNCYNAMKTYFADDAAGQAEMDDVCSQILNKVANDREIEQSDARNRICQDIKENTTPPTACGALVTEVQEAIDAAPNKICAGFAFGPGTTIAPGCEDPQPSNTSDQTTSGSYSMFAGFSLLLVLLNCYEVIDCEYFH